MTEAALRRGEAAGLEAVRRGLGSSTLHRTLFQIGIATGDLELANEQVAWAAGKPEERQATGWETGAAASAGQLRIAAGLRRRAVALAQRAGEDTAASAAASDAFVLAVIGQCDAARAESAAAKTSTATATVAAAGFTLGYCGDALSATALADRLLELYPRGTLEKHVHAPVIRAAAALPQNPAQVLSLLEIARTFDRVASFRTQYLRGQAYLRLSRGPEASAEFQYILDHRGEDVLSVLYPLAYVGLARAATLTGDTGKARTAYETFFEMWKDADPDIPILREARQEAARLK
ncbi:MAG TPA: hypothetical protein VES67_05085 [Vicinamibacterales bacterium]|nr:hypothetical protein [Vicinamibacterales bacterium]